MGWRNSESCCGSRRRRVVVVVVVRRRMELKVFKVAVVGGGEEGDKEMFSHICNFFSHILGFI